MLRNRIATTTSAATAAAADEPRVFLTLAEAVALLPDRDRIHTFRGQLLPIGATWDRAKVLETLEKARVIEESGPFASRFGHRLCAWDEHGPLFIETKDLPQ